MKRGRAKPGPQYFGEEFDLPEPSDVRRPSDSAVLCNKDTEGQSLKKARSFDKNVWVNPSPKGGASSHPSTHGGRSRRRPSGLELELNLGSLNITHNASQVLDFLYLGSEDCSRDDNVMGSLGVSTVVNCTLDLPNLFESKLRYIRVPLEDNITEDLLCHLHAAVDTINETRIQGGVAFVHCKKGMSRSVAIVIAYLMKHCNMCLLEALDFTKARRPQASPNTGYMAQLVEFEMELRQGKATVDMEKYKLDRFASVKSLRLDTP